MRYVRIKYYHNIWRHVDVIECHFQVPTNKNLHLIWICLGEVIVLSLQRIYERAHPYIRPPVNHWKSELAIYMPGYFLPNTYVLINNCFGSPMVVARIW